MTELGLFCGMLIDAAASNAIFAAPLALLSRWLQSRDRYPFLAHMLWLIVLIKLVTPPVFSLPILSGQAFADGVSSPASSAPLPETAAVTDPSIPTLFDWRVALAGVWLLGSAAVSVWVGWHALRFNSLLRQTSSPAGRALRDEAIRVAAGLGVRRAPAIYTTRAAVAPMVWWIGGSVQVYLPCGAIQALEPMALRAILAHELAHVRRGDHIVRWLESMAAILLWWNPLAWWARRNLRVCEEVCCDAFVLSKGTVTRDAYACALVSVLEQLTAGTPRASRIASRMNGGVMERRVKMILSKKPVPETSRWLRGIVLAGAALVLPLGLTRAQDSSDLTRVAEWLESGVNAAYITQEQADLMLNALRASRFGNLEAVDDAGNVIRLRQPGVELELSAENPMIVVRPDGSSTVTVEALEVTMPRTTQ